MNSKELIKLISKIEALKNDAEDTIQEIIENREEKFYDRSEKWQESEKGEEFSALTEEIDMIKDDSLDSLNESISRIEEMLDL